MISVSSIDFLIIYMITQAWWSCCCSWSWWYFFFCRKYIWRNYRNPFPSFFFSSLIFLLTLPCYSWKPRFIASLRIGKRDETKKVSGIGKCLRAAAFSPPDAVRPGASTGSCYYHTTYTRWGFKCTWMIAWAIERRARRMRQKWIVAQGLNATEVCRAGSRDDRENRRSRRRSWRRSYSRCRRLLAVASLVYSTGHLRGLWDN